jgi:hypothetical protein
MRLPIRIFGESNYDFTIQNDYSIQSYIFVIAQRPDSLILDPDFWVLKKTRRVTCVNEPECLLPAAIEIGKVYPNPFNSSINIEFSITGESQRIDLSIFDIEGKLIRRLRSGISNPGNYAIKWDALDNSGAEISSGVYFIRLLSSRTDRARKVTYLR